MRLYTAQAYADRHAKMSLDVAEGEPVNRTNVECEHWEVVTESNAPGFVAEELDGADAVNEVIGGGVGAVVSEPAEGMVPTPPAPVGSNPRYVTNRGTGLAHRLPEHWSVSQPMYGWKAACGWSFAGANALLTVAQPQRPWCTQHGCFKGAPPTDGNESGDSVG